MWFTVSFDPRLHFSRTITHMVGRRMAPQNVHVLIPIICDYVTYRQGGIKTANQQVLKWRLILVYPRGPTLIMRVFVSERRQQETQCQRNTV